MTNGAENTLDQNVSSDGSIVTGQRLTLLAYLLAASLPALVLYLRLIVMHYKAGDPPAMIFFLIPVIICAYLGGVWPGVLATLLAGLAVGYFLLPPLHSLAISDWIHKTQWLAMLTEGILVSLLTESLLRVRRKGKEAYQSLQKNQALLSGVISSTMDGIIAVDSNHRVTLFNPGAEQMFGCSAQEAVGQSLNRFIPERFRTRHTLHINEFARSDVSHQMTGKSGPLYGLRNNGTEFPIAASISQIDMSGHKMYAALVRDATEQKQAEEHLRRNRDHLSLALDVSKLGTYDRYIPEDRMEWSERALEIMGLPSGTSLSYDQYLEMLHPEDRPTMERAREESWKSNRDFETELRIIWPDGSLHWLVVRGRPYHDESGRPLRSSGVIQDITHKKKVEEAQLRSQKLESLGTLTGGIAHDFNNILFAISGNAEQASDDLPPDHPGQFSLNEIKKGARRAADLVRQVLTFNRPRDEKHEILQVERVVDEAVKMMRATLPAMIEIRTSFAPGLPPANVDPSQIHQIVVNLTTNASHAIGNHAGVIEVLLTATVVGAEESALRQVTPGRYVLLEVTDNGCGMDQDTRERIFDPFLTTKPVGQGTGLGLFVVDGIARSHGGAVTVYSEPGKGTVFHVYLPVAHKHAEAQPVKAPVPVPRGDKWHVLYVDDEEALVSLVSCRLSRLGYEVTGFTDAEEALREFASRPGNFDAIVTDLSMPRLSGFDLLRQVLTLRPNIATVMTTGYLRPEDHEMAQQIGVQEIILKPGTTEELGIALDALRRKSGKHRE
jgi:PAS domain S-box-containing protein